MAEILGIGCSHAPMILNPAEEWGRTRARIYARVPDYQPPSELLADLGGDNGLTADRQNQERIVKAFRVLHDRLHAWAPDVVMVIGDDQAENFLSDNLPVFSLYTGTELEGYPFHRALGHVNLWGAGPETKYTFHCPSAFAIAMRDHLILNGFDMASSNALKGWKWGLPHAHINPLMFLDPEGKFPLLPLFVNCYGEEAGPGYPPRPTARRCYALGQAIRGFLDGRRERVAVVASSSWSHSFLTHRFQCSAFDTEFDRHNLERIRQGRGSELAALTPEEIYLSGDHEFLNWIIALGVIGDKPAEIVDVLDAQSQISFKVFALWE
jgi:aromatic ring-opening dioxygenase catalytic subunit (LigB family)